MYWTKKDKADALKALVVLITGVLWSCGVYYFGMEAYISSWEIGHIAILALWVFAAGPIIAAAVMLVLSPLILYVLK